MTKEYTKTTFVEVIGNEIDDTKTLKICAKSIKEHYPTVIEKAEEIKNDTILYLVAHGEDPLLVKNPKFGDKTPREVSKIVLEILSNFGAYNQFEGKIILEGCHTAENNIDSDSRQKIQKILKEEEPENHSEKFIKLEKVKSKGNSFLERFLEELKKNNKARLILAPEVIVGGYCGFAFDSKDYKKDTYGTSVTHNPVTKILQDKRGASYQKNQDHSLKYDKESSYIELRWRQHLSKGSSR